MRKVSALIWLEIIKLLRVPSVLMIMFVMPLVFTLVFGGLFDQGNQKIHITVVDQDQTILSKALYKRLSQDPILDVKQASLSVGETNLKDKKTYGLIIIPKGFAEKIQTTPMKVAFRHGPELSIAVSIRQTLDNMINQLVIKVKAADLWSSYTQGKNEEDLLKQLVDTSEKPVVSIQSEQITKSVEVQKLNNTTQQAIGFSIMFLMFLILTATGAILQARQIGVWSRLLSAPVTRLQILLGYLFSFFLIGWFQFSILMILSSLLYGIEWGDPIGMIVLISAILLAVIGLGLFLAGMVHTTEQQSAIGTLVIVSTCMLGGIFWPLEIVPEYMQKVAEFVPQTWAMRGFTELMARGGSVVDIWEYVLILLGFAVVFLSVGISRIRYEV